MENHTDEYSGKMQFHTFLSVMRRGRHITLERLARGLCSESMLTRIEEGERLPGKMLRDRLLARLGLANDGYEDFLWADEYRAWQRRQKLLEAVENKDILEAEKMIACYERQGEKKDKIERQFYLTMRAQVIQDQGVEYEELRRIYGRAIDCTLPGREVKQWKESLLSEQEWNLLLEYIGCGGSVGQLSVCADETYQMAAYEILLSAIEEAGMDSYCLVKIYPKAVYALCLELMKEVEPKRHCGRILQLCSTAVELLRSTKRMFYLCELLEIMESVLEGLRKREDGENGVWIGDVTLSRVRLWRKVLTGLYQSAGVSEKMQNCVYLYRQAMNRFAGEVVRRRRKLLGMTKKELCEGICHEKTLRRLESGTAKTQREVTEKLLGRLRVSPEYQRHRIVTDRYEALILYDAVSKALNNRDMKTMGGMLPQLKAVIPMEPTMNRQEIAFLNSLYLWHTERITKQECLISLKEILEKTVPLEKIRQAKEEYLSDGELIYFYNIADKAEGEEKADLMESAHAICKRLVSENGIGTDISIYELMMDSVASYYGNAGKYDRSDEISDKIIKEDLVLRRMTMLHESIYNKLWNHSERIKESGGEEDKKFLYEELEKCIRLAELCKEIFSEEFYTKKQKEVSKK